MQVALTGNNAGACIVDRCAHPEVPFVRAGVGDDIVVADGDERAVIEQRDQHQHQHRQLEEAGPLDPQHTRISIFCIPGTDTLQSSQEISAKIILMLMAISEPRLSLCHVLDKLMQQFPLTYIMSSHYSQLKAGKTVEN